MIRLHSRDNGGGRFKKKKRRRAKGEDTFCIYCRSNSSLSCLWLGTATKYGNISYKCSSYQVIPKRISILVSMFNVPIILFGIQ